MRRSGYLFSGPYWLTVKYAGECSRCKKPISRGVTAFYYPKERTMLCNRDECGGQASRDLDAAKFDEEQYQSQY